MPYSVTPFSVTSVLKSLLLITLLFTGVRLKSQCTIVSSCGYSVTIHIRALSIVPSSTNCTSGPGYNYNVKFTYTIYASGTNTCSSGTLGVQPQIFCNGGQNNGYFTISNAIPSGAVSVANSGTLTTTTNPWRAVADCNTSTPSSLGCNSMQVTIFGPGISSSTYTCSFSTLPIELYEFYGYRDEGAVVLKWSTASELNNDFFSLEKSEDGTEWETIEKIKGAGTTRTPVFYKTYDRSIADKMIYYRLKQTDFDGTFAYSPVILVDGSGRAGNITLFPNPANESVTIESSDDLPKIITLSDMRGRQLLSRTIGRTETLSVAELDPGFYILKVSGSREQFFKLIKK